MLRSSSNALTWKAQLFLMVQENIPHHKTVVNLEYKKLSLKVSLTLSFSIRITFTSSLNKKKISEWGKKKKESDTNLRIFQQQFTTTSKIPLVLHAW